jgi:hypothetical protein
MIGESHVYYCVATGYLVACGQLPRGDSGLAGRPLPLVGPRGGPGVTLALGRAQRVHTVPRKSFPIPPPRNGILPAQRGSPI